MKITVYDLPNSFDRYTVVIERDNKESEFYGMSFYPEMPNGFNLYIGSNADGYYKGKHLGKKVSFESLDLNVQRAIANRAVSKMK
jgi:hypothetical protein